MNDPDERVNLAQDPKYSELVEELSTRIDEFFNKYADPQWDLWKGGVVESNSTRPFLWKEIQGDDLAPKY